MKIISLTNLFWTGGWDSTYRLLNLVLEKNKTVQPYYLIDSKRSSTRAELETMQNIKELLFHEYPHTKNLILPTIITDKQKVKQDGAIDQAYKNVIRKYPLGPQYPWLATFCKEKSIDDMELCLVSAKGKATSFRIRPNLEAVEKNSDKFFRVKTECYGTPEGILFRYYRFPIIHLTKLQINELVNQKGWFKIMELTWFCHRPFFGCIPCGICSPCTDAFNENMEWRFPFYLVFLNKIKVLSIFRYFRKQIIKLMNN